MSDLIERLRKDKWHVSAVTCEEAADTIEALTAERDALREALRLIEHATSPTPDDGGFHEAAHDIASVALAARKDAP